MQGLTPVLTPLLTTESLLWSVDTTYHLQNRSDLLRMDRTIESMRLGVELERMERKPSFSLRFEHMLPYGGMMPNTYTVMGMISIPIAPWSSKTYRSNIRRSEEHTSELQSLMRTSYAVFCLKKKKIK